MKPFKKAIMSAGTSMKIEAAPYKGKDYSGQLNRCIESISTDSLNRFML
jgi:hypothetical protein